MQTAQPADVLAEHSLGSGDFKFWTSFSDIQKILKDLLTAEEQAEMDKAGMKLVYLRGLIELKMLALTTDLISGQEASSSAFKNSKDIASMLNAAEAKLPTA